MECWAPIYTGLSNKMLTGQGISFGPRFIPLVRLHDFEVHYTSVKSYASLVLYERYHEPLRTIYRKIISENKNIDKKCHLPVQLGP